MRALPLGLLLAALVGAPAIAAEPTVGPVTLIPVHDGVNRIDGFAKDGRSATIVRAWRDNGNAHGHDVYLVTMALKSDDGPSNTLGVVTFDDGEHPLEDTATASPFDGERVLQTIRFAHAAVNGAPATLMIRADLGESKSGGLADHAPATVSYYQLQTPGVDVGTSPDVFRLVKTSRAPGLYCNADLALSVVLHLPAPKTPGTRPGGCFD